MTGRLDLLELLHPDGHTTRVAVLGTGCPPQLASASGAAVGPADLVVLAPSAGELQESGWFERSVRSAAAVAAPDAIIYALLPAAKRSQVRRLLEGAGFRLGTDMLHLPSWRATRHIVPLRRSLAWRAIDAVDSRRLVGVLLAIPGAARIVGRTHGAVAVVARRPGGRPLFEWLFRGAGLPSDRGTVVVRAKWRAGKAAIVLQAVDGAARTLAVAKTTLVPGGPNGRTEREVDCLAQLGPAARAAGAAVPTARLTHLGAWPVSFESVVPGRRASELLASRGIALDIVVDRIVGWLEAWSRATAVRRPLDRERLEREVLRPARLLAPRLDGGARYVAWLEERCEAIAGETLPLVAAHGDLTMSNVHLTASHELGVVDWEASSGEGLPLRDFWYAAVDAAAALDHYTDRPAAFARCFGGDGALRPLVSAHEARLAGALELPSELAALCFHGCWLQHAVDEQRKRGPGEAKPFLAIVQWLTSHPSRLGGPAGVAA